VVPECGGSSTVARADKSRTVALGWFRGKTRATHWAGVYSDRSHGLSGRPGRFSPDATAVLAEKKAVCAAHGLAGISPLDRLPGEPAAWFALPRWRRIALCNEAHIRRSAALIANVTPFRGPSADPGTAYEIGFMRALGRPVFSYANTASLFGERTRAALGLAVDATEDTAAMLIEAFDLFDNLMIDAAIAHSGGSLTVVETHPDARWTDSTAFRRCVAAVARVLV
jgi:nucleoside 2-deoxyribosyltransferase